MSEPSQLGAAFDLLAAYEPNDGFFFERSGLGVAGGPPSERVAARDALSRLRASWPDGVVVGALPLAGDPATLSIPDPIVTRRVPGRASLVARSDAPRPSFERFVGGSPSDAFTALQRHEVPPSERYAEAVAEAVAAIAAGELRKVVLARTVEVDAARKLDPRRLVHRLRAVDPAAYSFIVPTDRGEMVGASPELLVSRSGDVVRSNPLAGSAPRSGDPEEDRANGEALRGSAKNREEHAIVVEAVAETLAPFCDELRWDPQPVLLATPNIWHLSTRFEGRLRDPAPSVLELVAALHPTPAVVGAPTSAALDLIRELEPFSRGRYAGPVGWMDASGDGEWAIALRCAELTGERAVLYAGAGIVAASDPASEVDETERKFRAFLDALRWG